MRGKNITYFVLGAALAAGGLYSIAVSDMLNFQAGTPIKSAEVNQNFSALKSAVQALEAPVGVSRLAVSGTAADGKVLKLSGSALAWGDDLIGTGGGASFSAGEGLALNNNVFSLSNGGVTAGKLATQNPAAVNKFLAFNGSAMVWADGTSGSVGPQGPKGDKGDKGDTGPQGPTGTAVIADSSITNAKLANAAVTAAKIADSTINPSKLQLPLNLSSSSNNLIFTVTNTGSAIRGDSTSGRGVTGSSQTGIGVEGGSASGWGLLGTSQTGFGVEGGSASKVGVRGSSQTGIGVEGESAANDAIIGISKSAFHAGIVGANKNGGFAAYFEAGSAVCSFKAGTTGWSCSSDKNLKEKFRPIDSAKVLDAVAQMPITTWSIKGSKVRQLGPTAQDFKAAFNLGDSDKSINNTDAQGVALAAIQGLNTKLESENAGLRQRLAALEKRFEAIERRQ